MTQLTALIREKQLERERLANQYASLLRVQNEQNDFIENPFEVEEGVIECKCGSKRVFSYSKQTRGADEPMTTFAQCMSCKKSWSYSG